MLPGKTSLTSKYNQTKNIQYSAAMCTVPHSTIAPKAGTLKCATQQAMPPQPTAGTTIITALAFTILYTDTLHVALTFALVHHGAVIVSKQYLSFAGVWITCKNKFA